MQRLEDLDFIAQFRKVARAGQPGRAAADDGDLVPVAGCGLCRGGAVFELPVADEAFEFADGDRFAFDAQDAGAFALRFLRADAAADRGQRTVAGDDVGGLLQLPGVQGSDEVGDADADGAGSHTAGIPAVQAARRFQPCLVEVEKLGVEIETDVIVGRTVTIDSLLDEEGYAAVFIGSGAGLPRFMGIPGENLNGVVSANEFLTRANLMRSLGSRNSGMP